MTEQQRKEMMKLADSIKGEINRMCLTKDRSRFVKMYGLANTHLDNLYNMIYDARFCVGENAEGEG